jgi:hypothetical protein
VDVQVGMLLSSFDDGIRKQTESYWRDTISKEIVSYAMTDESENINIDKLNTIFQIANKVKDGSN